MGIIELSGSQYLNTSDEKQAWRLVDGSVLVFVMPIGRAGALRRMHLARLDRGCVIPSLSRRAAMDGETLIWQLLILPEGKAALEAVPVENGHRTDFLRMVGLNRRGLEIDEKLYGDILTREYAARQRISNEQISRRLENSKNFAEKSINSLRASYAGDTEHQSAQDSSSGEALYDAVSFLCARRKLPVAPLGTIHAACGRDYDVRDIARLSGFVCREIKPDGKWHGRDMEPMLCFKAEDMSPVVCYRAGKRRLRCWDASGNSFSELTEELIQGLADTAYVFCRPLPGSAVTIKEISLYALHELSAHDIAVMLIGSFLATFVSLQFARLSETLYDIIIPQGSNQLLWGYGALMVAYMLGGVCFNIAKGIGSLRLNSRIKYSLQTAIYDRLFHLPESFFRGHENADLAYRAGMLADTYTGFFNNVSQIIMMLLFSGIYLAKMYRYSGELSNIGLIFIVLNIAVSLGMGWLLNRLQRKRARMVGSLRSFLFQAFSGINTLRSSGAEDAALHKYMEKYVEMCKIEQRSGRRQQLSTALSSFISALATVMLYKAVTGPVSLSVGGFMGFTSAYSALSSSMLQVASCLLSVFVMLPMLINSMEIMKYPPERADKGYVPRQVKGDIRVAGVSFAYGKSDKLQLQDINLHIKPGEYVALVGPSGCGKSTLLRLLLGFEKPLRGKIYYDGVELERINKPELRRKMGVVLQDGVLFSGSIYRNIRIARPTATNEQVLDAVRAAALEEDIAAMPLGLNTVVSEQAQTVSGGQKQRILLARAVIGQPSVLMLDEATSALDNITQARVCENLAKLGSTRIVVAHRLSTVKDCDRIIVMDAGRIVEEGSFSQLMEKKGAFWQLARMQSL